MTFGFPNQQSRNLKRSSSHPRHLASQVDTAGMKAQVETREASDRYSVCILGSIHVKWVASKPECLAHLPQIGQRAFHSFHRRVSWLSKALVRGSSVAWVAEFQPPAVDMLSIEK